MQNKQIVLNASLCLTAQSSCVYRQTKKRAFSLINDSDEVVDLGEEVGQKAEGGEE